jgi:hypothetical protein
MAHVRTYIITLISLLFLGLSSNTLAAEDCKPGYTWDSSLNRCMYSSATVERRDDYDACKYSTSEQWKSGKCNTEAYAQQQLAEDGRTRQGTGDTDDVFHGSWSRISRLLGIGALGFQGVALGYAKYADKDFSFSMSGKIFAGATVYGLYSLYKLNDKIDGELESMKSSYNAELNNKDSWYNAQVSAFDYLIKEQEHLKDTYDEQSGTFRNLGIAYTIAAGVAVYEIITTPKGTDKCTQVKGDANLHTWASSPCIIAALGGIAAMDSFNISNKAKEEMKEVEVNIVALEEVKKKFVSGLSNNCPEGRDDLSKPYCYCYTDDGEKAPNRSNSQTCQQLWNRYENQFVATTDKEFATPIEKYKACVFVDGKFDKECKCKRLKNKKGQNACMKVTAPGGVVNAYGANYANQAVSDVNDALSGQAKTAKISDVNAVQAAKDDKKRDEVLKKMKDKLAGIMKTDPDKYGKGLLEKISNNSRVAIYGDRNPAAKARMMRPKLSGVQEVLKKHGGEEAVSFFMGGKGFTKSKAPEKKKKKSLWDFGETGNASGAKVVQFDKNSDYMQKKFKYKKADIVRDRGVSIWKVITNRYTQSGLKRLFSDDESDL